MQVLEAAEINSFFGECFCLTVKPFVFALTVNSLWETEFFGINIKAMHFLPFVLRNSEISATVTQDTDLDFAENQWNWKEMS